MTSATHFFKPGDQGTTTFDGLSRDGKGEKQLIIQSIMKDEDVLFNWATAADIDDEALSNELLSHVVNLWLTIRGFSTAGAWIEHYKQCKSVKEKFCAVNCLFKCATSLF